MKITFLDINASYSHSSPALPLLHTACAEVDATWSRVSGTIGDKAERLAVTVAEQQPDIVLGTVYLFTQEVMLKVLRRIHALLPETVILLGGPEFLGNNEDFLRRAPCVTAVLRGEGEEALPALLSSLPAKTSWPTITGWCRVDADGYHDNGMALVDEAAWNALPAPDSSEFFNWERPFIQIETTRGCPHNCAFCTSCRTGRIRWRDLDDVRAQLHKAQERGIEEIRVLDRTFNATPTKAIERLTIFRDEFPQLRFHLEIHPGFLPDELKQLLAAYPAGKLHLEVGLQTTHREALRLCKRKGTTKELLAALRFLCGCANLDIHVDLLSGLPALSLKHLLQDLNTVVRQQPEEIQLETLKVLPGTPVADNAAALGLRYAPDPPYEVLAGDAMSGRDILTAADLSRVVDHYYNVPELRPIVSAAVEADSNFLPDFLEFLHTRTDITQKPGLVRRGRLLHQFLAARSETLKELLEYRWLQSGMPPSKCPGNIQRVSRIPDNADLKQGDPTDDLRRLQVWQLDQEILCYWFAFDRSRPARTPVAVFNLSSADNRSS